MKESVRDFVRGRAADRCEYCLLPQTAAPFFTFHVEHIDASQHVRDDRPENLCLACPRCNLNKGPNVATLLDEDRRLIRLFHPRNDRWAEHFVVRAGRIDGCSETGVATARLLRMNEPDRVALRRVLVERGEFFVPER